MTLRSRTAAKGNNDEHEDDANTPKRTPVSFYKLRVGNSKDKAEMAVKSLQNCYKICILSVIVDLIIVLIDDELYSKVFGKNKLLWTDIIDLMDSFQVLVLGRGLRGLIRLYQKLIESPDEHLSDDDAIKLFTVMKIVWRTIAICLGAVAVSNAAALPTHAVDGPLSSIFEQITASKCIFFMLSFLGLFNIAIRMYCRLSVAKEVKGGVGKINVRKVLTATPRLKSPDKETYGAYLSQALAMGSISANAILGLLKWIVLKNTMFGRLWDASDVVTPFALTGLLFLLNRSFLRTVLTGRGTLKTTEAEVRNSLLEAQSSFYDKASDIIKGVTIVRILPYLTAPIEPYVMGMTKQYAPALVEKFGLS